MTQTRESGSQYALRVLQDKIVHLELEPGSWVSENELADSLALSRTPVRAAIQELSTVRLIEIYPQKGSRIARIDYSLVEEARFMRLALERAVVELLCATITQEALAQLEENLKYQEIYLQMEDNTAFFRADNEFHHLLFILANKETSYRMMNGLTAHFDRVRQMASRMETNRTRNLEDHRALVQAIGQHDAPLAMDIVTRHLTHYQVDEGALRDKYPETYFA